MRNMILFIILLVGAGYWLIQHGADVQEKEANHKTSHQSDYKL